MSDWENQHAYHPATPESAPRHDAVRRACVDLARTLDQLVPEGLERDEAQKALQVVRMWANAGIAIRLSPRATEEQRTTPQPSHGQEVHSREGLHLPVDHGCERHQHGAMSCLPNSYCTPCREQARDLTAPGVPASTMKCPNCEQRVEKRTEGHINPHWDAAGRYTCPIGAVAEGNFEIMRSHEGHIDVGMNASDDEGHYAQVLMRPTDALEAGSNLTRKAGELLERALAEGLVLRCPHCGRLEGAEDAQRWPGRTDDDSDPSKPHESRHALHLGDEGWTIQHSGECRRAGTLTTCDFTLGARHTDFGDPDSGFTDGYQWAQVYRLSDGLPRLAPWLAEPE